jgi:hypothetical protein
LARVQEGSEGALKADTVDLAAIFGQPVHYEVPLYQRPYVWTREKQWEHLWEDVQTVADRQLDETEANDSIPHFLGAVVLEQSLHQVGMIGARTVIDGQQRLTTLQLLIAAARSVAVDRQRDDARRMFEKLLLNDDFLVRQPGDEHKVIPTQRDRVAFREAMSDGIVATTGSHRIHEAFRFFRSSIEQWATDGADDAETGRRLGALSTAVWKRLILVTIDLDPGDNAQVIFETLNALGTPLLAADLIKNHLFQTAVLQGEEIDKLYEQSWAPFDAEDASGNDWWREEIQQGRLLRPRLDTFMNHWLAMASGREVVSHQLFPEFKRYLASDARSAAIVLEDLARYGKVYAKFETEPLTTELGQFLYRLRILEVTTAYPALLWLLGPDGIDDDRDRTAALQSIESWLVRRMLARQTTKNYNYVFLALLKSVRDAAATRGTGPTGADVRGFFAGLSGENQLWPTAGMVRTSLRTMAAYTALPRARLRMVLEALERGTHTDLTENVSIPTDLTVEHVLPQDWQAHWPLPDTVDPVQGRVDRDTAKQRLGNLTLVTGKLNPKMSNGPWETKRAALREHSVMRISTDIRNAEAWDEDAIRERGERLISQVLLVWSRPDDSDAEQLPGLPDQATSVSKPAGPPDPDDPSAFAPPLAVADEIGVGSELRRIVRRCRELGLYLRPDRLSVMVSPPADKRMYLFTVWPQWDEGGSFKLWKSPAAFARWIPGVTLEAAQAALGVSEDAGVLLVRDTEAFLARVADLTPAEWATSSFDDRRAEILALGIPNLERAPGSVLRLIDHRAAPQPEIAFQFVGAALGHTGVILRPQQSKGDPWYFQVRHPKFSQVVAYVNPRPGEARIEFRLPGSHPTYEIATGRDGPYGIVVTVRDNDGFRVAVRLLDDALAVDG